MGKTDILSIRCPRCKKADLRQFVDVFVQCSAGNRKLSKAGLRSPDVEVWGVSWDTACYFCPRHECGYNESLLQKSLERRDQRIRELEWAVRTLRDASRPGSARLTEAEEARIAAAVSSQKPEKP